MSQVFEIADAYVLAACELDPYYATYSGVSGYDDQVTDYSPAGFEARYELWKKTVAQLAAATPANDDDRIAAKLVGERLGLMMRHHEAGDLMRNLRVIDSQIQSPRQSLDLLPHETREQWESIARRMSGIPQSLHGLRETLRLGISRGIVAARRQAIACAEQCESLLGDAGPSYFHRLISTAPSESGLVAALRSGADASVSAYQEMAHFLRDEYAPQATEQDAFGRERYQMFALDWVGTQLDLDETYQWGWDELHRIQDEMNRVAAAIVPGGTVLEAVEFLESDPSRQVEGIENLLKFLQERTDSAISELSGKHFDIPPEIRRIECREAPPGTSAAMYYTRPSEDYSRPGRTWYPAMGKTIFPLWTEVSTSYHEGVPGHHLQAGLTPLLKDHLTRYQRSSLFISGHGEGWALYAERLMHELGYLEKPDYVLGMLTMQAWRAVRVIVDIGLHLGLEIPHGESFNPGRVWDFDLALEFLKQNTPHDESFALSELIRYCGLAGQAISYKVGEREWLAIRAAVQAKLGSKFNLKEFHDKALRLGPVTFDILREEMLAVAP